MNRRIKPPPVDTLTADRFATDAAIPPVEKMTATEYKKRFVTMLGVALGLIIRRYVYLDTIQVLVYRWPTKLERARLRSLNPGEVPVKKTRGFRTSWTIRMHQPSQESILLLDRMFPGNRVNRLDFALDLTVAGRKTASELQAILRTHITQPWRAGRDLSAFHRTDYYAGAWDRRNIVIYSDRPSKMDDRPAVHIELRFYRAQVCRTLGVSRVTDLIGFDPTSAMQRNCRLSVLNWKKAMATIDKFVSQSMRSQKPGTNRRRLSRNEMRIFHLRRFARLLQDEELSLTQHTLQEARVQAWLDLFRDEFDREVTDIGRAVITLPADALFRGIELMPPLIKGQTHRN